MTIDQVDVWNPANTGVRLFVAEASLLAEVFKEDPGVGRVADDELQIDGWRFASFLSRRMSEYERSNNGALRALMEGFLAVSLVMLLRAKHPLAEFTRDPGKFWRQRIAEVGRGMPV
ncbi:hypothetical protein GCM10012287_08130 [Streptomyces daqingensis]|uniref:Uncharacterized protein n=1 Tax=Streptomyces daqingensis TaxID=1472640 RepID=A0ABQ2LW20_9ACTN|nr:DUF6086 family protein [Streptomyces daqingensis]GGO43894.1 hypothetical protein GCM10012287_08130 [Streptomyces daqingensis]